MKSGKTKCIGGMGPEVRHKYNSLAGKFQPVTKGSKFILGPIDYEWKLKANSLPGKAGAVADGLLFLKGVQRNSLIKVTAEVQELSCCSRQATCRGLKAFESANLIEIFPKPGLMPRI